MDNSILQHFQTLTPGEAVDPADIDPVSGAVGNLRGAQRLLVDLDEVYGIYDWEI